MLVVDDDLVRRAERLANLIDIGSLSVVGAGTAEFHEAASSVRPDVIVLEPDADGGILPAARDLLFENAQVRCIIFGYERAQKVRLANPRVSHRLHGMSYPARAAELLPLLRKRKTSSRVGPFSPAECVQSAGAGKLDVRLECIDSSGAPLGEITMSAGRVWAARTATTSGFEAFAWLVTRFDARVIFGTVRAAERQADLEGDWQSLMLDAMRHIDRDRHLAPPVSSARSLVDEHAAPATPESLDPAHPRHARS